MPTLKAAYDRLDEIPEPIREYYSERDGKYVISAEGVHTDTDITGLKSALDAERRRAKDLERNVTPWSDLGKELGTELSPQNVKQTFSEYRRLQEELQRVVEDKKGAVDLAVAERVKTLEQQAATERAKVAETLEAERQRADKYERIVRDKQFTDAVASAVGEHVHPSAIQDVVNRAKSFGWQLRDDGTLFASDPRGDTVYSRRHPTAPIGFEEWVQENLFKEAPHFFKQSEGTGDRNRGSFRGAKFPARRSQMTQDQRVAYVSEHGAEAFMTLDP